MTRDQLEHVLRASAAIANETSFVVIGDITAICPEIHDLAVSKCAASREKDADFVRVLLREHMIEAGTLELRIRQLDPSRHPVNSISAWAARRAAEAAAT
jgi:hypothetical protein